MKTTTAMRARRTPKVNRGDSPTASKARQSRAGTVPRIVQSPITKQWFVMTRYTEREGINTVTGEKVRYYFAQIKHDVTDQMTAILKAKRRR